MENLIELLKKNMVPIGLWPKFYGEVVGKAMQEKVEEIGMCGNFRTYIHPGFGGIITNPGYGYCWDKTYQLRADYEEKPEEPEIVECEICYDERHLHFDHERVRHSPREAYDQSDFIGFKFDDGTVFGSPVKYSVPGETSHGYYAYYGAIKTGQALEHHATHVLFRRPK